MKIGDEVYIHGYVDEIRQNVVIIRNDGGYFGTVAEEITSSSEIPNTCGDAISRQSAIFLASDLKQDLPDDERIADMVMAHNEGILEYQTQLSLLPSCNNTDCLKCVLDKIRAEIMDFEEELFHRPNTDYSDYSAVRYCVEIIDKYKAESEEQE